MLNKILSKEDCSKCKFCCSFRRQSLWETPIFNKSSKEKLEKLYLNVHFREVQTDFFTIDLTNSYKTTDANEEAPCPFLRDGTGCILPPDLKPFDCSIWPLRIIKKDGQNKIVLTPTCKAINKLPLESVSSFVNSELKKVILSYAKEHPEIIKEDSDFFISL